MSGVLLTEFEAAKALAQAWNRLDPSVVIPLLANDVHYASQRVLEELETKEAVAQHLIDRMQRITTSASSNPSVKVFASLGKTTVGSPGRDCVVIAQGVKSNIATVILFKVENDKIKRIDLCVPDLLQAISSGVYPE
jgi:hypothetical protein